MIRLPAGHNFTERRFGRSLQDAFADSRAPCIERPPRRRGLNWALLGPVFFTVLALALLLLVKQRFEERRAITAACQAEQAQHNGNSAACRYLFIASKGGR